MANVNKLILIGRLTRDPEVRTFSNGGKVAKFGFAVNNRKKNSQTGQWEDMPVFIDCEVFNRGDNGKQADIAQQYLSKGKQVYLEGKLDLDTWDDKATGQKRQKHRMIVDVMQFLEPGQGGQGGAPEGGPRGRSAGPEQAGNYDNSSGDDYESGNSGGGGGKDEEIPF